MSLAALAAARHQAEALGNLVRGLELIAEAYPRVEPEERLHLRRLAGWIGGRLEESHAPELLRERLALPPPLAALLPSSPPAPPTSGELGVATAVLVDADASGEAFLASLVVEPEGAARPAASASAGAALALERAERAVLRLLAGRGTLRPVGYQLRWRGPPALERAAVEGASAGAAAALALFSFWSGLPVPPDLAVSAALAEDGRLLPVAAEEAKQRAALRERPRLRALLLPGSGAAGDARVRRVATLEVLLEEVFGPNAAPRGGRGALDVTAAVRLGVELYERRGRFAAAHEVLSSALEALEGQRRAGRITTPRSDELLALWRAGSSLVHLGDPAGAAALLGRAAALGEELWAAGEVNPQLYLGVRGNLAVLLRDLRRFDEASALLEASLALQRQLRQDAREQARTLGNLGELWTLRGDFPRAEAALREALARLEQAYPDEVPRELCYLGNLALRRGDPGEAAELYRSGLEANREVTCGRPVNEAFLRYGLARALLASGLALEAQEQAARALAPLPRHEPYPRQLILKVRGLAELALGRDEARATLLEAADLSFARGALARFGFSAARAELALHLLRAGAPARGEVGEQASAFAAASAELLDQLWGTGLAAQLRACLHHGDARGLTATLRAALELLAY